MSHLLLHIGFPKTGTTTLQRWMAEHCADRYIGKPAPGLELPDESLFRAVRNAVTKPPLWVTEQWSATEIAAVAEALASALDRFGRPILSDEDLVRVTARRGRGLPFLANEEPPIVNMLAAISAQFDVRVLVTVRAQATWLPSLYAELARQMSNPSQQDFERRVLEFLDDPSPTGRAYADWARWIELLHRAVGGQNVTCLLIEEIGTADYWRAMASLAGTQAPPPREASNSLSLDSGEWRLRDLIPRAAAQYSAPIDRGAIRVPDELRERIRAAYRTSNERLAALVDRNFNEFEGLGY